MNVTHFNFLIYGNLIALISTNLLISNQKLNYILLSLFINILILILMGSIKKLKVTYIIFFLSIIIVNLFYIEIDNKLIGIKPIIINIWLITSIILIQSLLHKEEKIFEKISRFFEIFSYIVIADLILSFFIKSNFYVVGEGFNYLIIPSPFNKYIVLAAIPFLFYRGGMVNITLSTILASTLILGTRAGIISTLITLILSSLFLFNIANKFKNSITIRFSVAFIIIAAYLFLFNSLTNNYKNNFFYESYYSSIARLVIWSENFEILNQNPFGVGPGIAQDMLNFDDDKPGFIVNYMRSFDNKIINKEINKRKNIYADKTKNPSEHSMVLYFIISYGIFGIFILLNIFNMLIKDFYKLFRNDFKKFSVIYISFFSVILFTLINSFHLGIFYLSLFYCYYIFYRNKHETN